MKDQQGSLECIQSLGGTARKRREEQQALQHWILGLGGGVGDGGGVDVCRGVDVVVEVEATEDVIGEPADKPEEEEGHRVRDQELAEKGKEQGEMKGERKKGEERMGCVERGKTVQMQMHRWEYQTDFQHLMHLRTEKDSVFQRLELLCLDTGTSARQSPESPDAQALSVEADVHARAVRESELRFEQRFLRTCSMDPCDAFLPETIMGIHTPPRLGQKVILHEKLTRVLFPHLLTDSQGGPGTIVWVDDGGHREEEGNGWCKERGRPKVLLEVLWEMTQVQACYPTGNGAYPFTVYEQYRVLKSQVLETGGHWSQIVACNESEQAEMLRILF